MASLGDSPVVRAWAWISDEDAVGRARVGDERAAAYLFDRYKSMVERQARLYYVAGAEHDDVMQEGMMGLWKAIRDYRTERLPRFAPFAEICVTRQIISAVKTALRNKHSPLNRSLSLEGHPVDGTFPLLELIADTKAGPDAALLSARLPRDFPVAVKQRLSSLELYVVQQYMAQRSYEQIARDLTCGTKRVDNALQRAKKKIRRLVGAAAG